MSLSRFLESSANGDSNEEEDELEHSPPKRSATSRKHHHSPSVASSRSSGVSSPKSEAPIAKKIPTTRSTVAKANLTSNPKAKQKACACSTFIEISAPAKVRFSSFLLSFSLTYCVSSAGEAC